MMTTKIRTEIAAQKQEPDAIDPDKATEQQQSLIKDLNKKFATYDQSLQSIVTAIQTLQKQVTTNSSQGQ